MTRGCRFPAQGSIVLQLIGGSGPFDLTGFTFEAQVRVQTADAVVLDLEPIITAPLTGTLELATFSDEETMLYTAGVYQWDLIGTSVTNDTTGRYLAGQFYIVNKITNS
jgi:hypothetical protein